MAADADTTISVTGLAKGDQVKVYKIAQPDQSVSAGWKLSGTYGTLTIADILDGVDTAEYGTIAAVVTTDEAYSGTVGTDGTWSQAKPDAGMYLVKVIPATASKIYNPMVVSADYDSSNATNTVAAKSTDVTVTKSTSDIQRDVANGDVIDFTISSTVPCYPSNYTNPVYKISDTLSGPITFTSITAVKLGNATLTEGTDYTIVTGDKNFTITLTSTALLKVKTAGTAQAIVVTYKGTVSSSANDFSDNVTRINNKAEVEYSNNPTDSSDTDKINDETNHYSFSLDANLAGNTTTVNEEIVKVGVDADGKDITNHTEVTTKNKTPLQGAAFTLTGGDSNKTYTATSDANGYLKFNGLDKGTYTLSETSAPAGYMVSTTTYSVVITPTYASDGKTLDSYTVKITDGNSNEITSSYTITNDATTVTKVTSEADVNMSLFKDTKAKALPSTGGMGTTIFYMVGAVLVIGAGVVMITRRRMDIQ